MGIRGSGEGVPDGEREGQKAPSPQAKVTPPAPTPEPPEIRSRVKYTANEEPQTGEVLAEVPGGLRIKSDAGPIHLVPADAVTGLAEATKPQSPPLAPEKPAASREEALAEEEPLVGTVARLRNPNDKTYSVAAIRQNHLMAYAKWTPEEDERLWSLHQSGCTNKELADLFQRKRGAIESRLAKLALVRTSKPISHPDELPGIDFSEK